MLEGMQEWEKRVYISILYTDFQYISIHEKSSEKYNHLFEKLFKDKENCQSKIYA